MASKLGLTNEVKEMKLGKSFNKNENQSFHTFRYDFMPASVDATKRANVEIGEGNQVTVTVPHIEGSGTSNTVFKGSKKPYQKECVLVIDHTTGEITLEKLSFNVQLKKTRAEGSSKIRSITPVETNFNSKKSPSSHKLSPQPKPSPVHKCSPLPKSPIQTSPSGTASPSMPCIGTLLLPKPAEESIEMPEVGVLSSSSSSDSSSAESSDSSDSEAAVKVPNSHGPMNGFMESQQKESVQLSVSMPTMNSLPSMPKFNQLSEDLQLSESDSESDC